MLDLNKIHIGDAWELSKQLDDNSISLIMTSPPYWNLRDYKIDGQFGLEETPEDYVNKLCDLFDILKDKLREDGSVYVNLGDTYSNSGGQGNPHKQAKASGNFSPHRVSGLPVKCLVQIPSMFSIEMVRRGWTLRNEIIWWKRNIMPQSAKDRFTVDFEKIFFFVKNKYYWFEKQYEPLKEDTIERAGRKTDGKKSEHYAGLGNEQIQNYHEKILSGEVNGRNKRCVWDITNRGNDDQHYAQYPDDLCRTPILSSCPKEICVKCGTAAYPEYIPSEIYKKHLGKDFLESRTLERGISGKKTKKIKLKKAEYSIEYKYCNCDSPRVSGIVLDPFSGTGTTCKMAKYYGRRFIGFELNPAYKKISDRKLAQEVLEL